MTRTRADGRYADATDAMAGPKRDATHALKPLAAAAALVLEGSLANSCAPIKCKRAVEP